MSTDLKRVIGRSKPTSKRIVVAYLPSERPDTVPEKHPSALTFEAEHDENFGSLYFGEGGVVMGAERTHHYNDGVLLSGEWREEFRALKVKTFRVMDENTARKVQAALEVMEATIARARDMYQAELQRAWDAARPLRQQDVDPEMREDT